MIVQHKTSQHLSPSANRQAHQSSFKRRKLFFKCRQNQQWHSTSHTICVIILVALLLEVVAFITALIQEHTTVSLPSCHWDNKIHESNIAYGVQLFYNTKKCRKTPPGQVVTRENLCKTHKNTFRLFSPQEAHLWYTALGRYCSSE